jgi:hypothetical protein
MKTMTPKEKAEDLFTTFRYALSHKDAPLGMYKDNMAIQCALIAVEEILNNNCGSHTDGSNATNSEIYCDEYFWNDVKSELQSL